MRYGKDRNAGIIPGCGSAWLERLVWDQEVAGSNPVTPITFSCGCSSMVEHQPSKLDTWVRFPSPAFSCQDKRKVVSCHEGPLKKGILI